MYDIRQFKPALYLLLAMGVTGFALAAGSPGLWLLAMGGIALNAWLVKTHRFTPMPRLLANLVTLAAAGIVVLQFRADDSAKILTIGEYLVLLHLVKLFEQRANRDYAQLLILSLLLMVAAAISTAGLLFGLLFILYMFFSLYCCLLFHLKVETDDARSNFSTPADQVNPATLRQDQRYLPTSMRRLTFVMSVVAVAMAIAVFLFFPRGAGEGMFTPVPIRQVQALTGFSDEVSFQKIAQITKSEDVIARVEVYHDNEKITQGRTLLLRGSALDVYSGNDANHTSGPYQWTRSRPTRRDPPIQQLVPELRVALGEDDRWGAGDVPAAPWRQVISLQPTGTNKLFAIAEPVYIQSMRDRIQVIFSARDDVLESIEPLNRTVQYTVWSTGAIETSVADDPTRDPGFLGRLSVIDPKILEYARQPKVCGVDESGRALADYALAGDHSRDAEIAANFERYLRTNFGYTLDLTNAGHLDGRDPIVAFLYDFKRGHCEYFAGAMTLMCQSLGIPARMVVGFRCEDADFNTLGDYYVVKQSNAHAWCEVFTNNRWGTYDPTSGRNAIGASRNTYFSKFKKLFDYLEYKWASSVVAYDSSNRRNVLDALNNQMSKTAVNTGQNVGIWQEKFRAWWDSVQFTVSSIVIGSAIALMAAVILAAVIYYFVERWLMHRRAKRIGLSAIDSSDQLRIARQLGFYDDLLRVLERHKISRSRHLTPLEFSQSLSFLPTGIYDDVLRLTQLFYRIRYGGIELNSHRQKRLAVVVTRIQKTMEAMGRRAAY